MRDLRRGSHLAVLVSLSAWLGAGACAPASAPPRVTSPQPTPTHAAAPQATPPQATPTETAAPQATLPQPAPVATAQDAAETVATLHIGESVTPPGSTTVVTLTDVSDDSRCPTGANCIWAGDATVTLRVQPATGAAETVALHINRADARSATVAGLHFRLERLDPAPQVGRPIERVAYVAAIVISK